MTIEDHLNPKAVKFLRDHLTALKQGKDHPRIHFDMEVWAAHTKGSEPAYGEREYIFDPPPGICGTAACLAGSLVLGMLGQKPNTNVIGGDYVWTSAAEDVLIRHNVSARTAIEIACIWYLDSWPDTFRDRYLSARTEQERAGAALDMFDSLLAKTSSE